MPRREADHPPGEVRWGAERPLAGGEARASEAHTASDGRAHRQRGDGNGSSRTSVGGDSSTTDEHSPSSPTLDVAIATELLPGGLRSDDAPAHPDALSAAAIARAARRRRMQHSALCALGCCGLLLLASMLTICVAFTGRALGPLAPLVVDVLAHRTGLTVAGSEFARWILQPPPAQPTATAPLTLLPQAGALKAAGARAPAARPNVLIFLADDLGYTDPKVFGLHAVGHSNNSTPNIDKMAADGLMLTQFLTETICTPARAALLTGRYPARYGMSQDVLPQRVIFTPGAPSGLPKRELTLGSALKASGYRTGLSGKWHLGISAAPEGGGWNGTNAFLPFHHGFDDSLVFPFSNFQRCDPYSGRSPPRPDTPPPPDLATATLLATRHALARAARQAAHAAATAASGGAGAPPPSPEPALLRSEEWAPELTAGWETRSASADEERARLERLMARELNREAGVGGPGAAGAGHDERVGLRAERREERSGRHLERSLQRNGSADFVHTAADVFAHAAGLESGSSEYGYADNGLFCFLMANNTIVQQPADMLNLEDALVRHAVTFIRRATTAGLPWLLLFADLHPHTALFNHPRFGPGPPGPFESSNGQYGQVLREMDWALGELLSALEQLSIERDTLVLLTSDNGPYQEEGWAQSGRKGGLKGGKGQTWEGGIRVPAIVRWPGVIPAGAISSAPVRALDIMPTVCAFAGVRLPASLLIDGVDQSAFFQRPTDALNGWLASKRTSFHYCGTRPLAARYLEYKLHWATQRWEAGHEAVCTECCPHAGYTAGLFGSTTLCQCDGKALDEHSPPLVYNIRRDPNETRPIKPGSSEHSHVLHAVERAREEHVRSLEAGVPCVNCPLPVPLKTWPCCQGSLPECRSEHQCGLTATLSATCTFALIDHMRNGRGRCECNYCREGDCGTEWA